MLEVPTLLAFGEKHTCTTSNLVDQNTYPVELNPSLKTYIENLLFLLKRLSINWCLEFGLNFAVNKLTIYKLFVTQL